MLLTSKHVGTFHPQTTFDRIVHHQRNQNYRRSLRTVKKSTGEIELLTAYCGDNGCQCAAMAVIPPTHYIPQLEDHTVKSKYLSTIMKLLGHDENLVYDMQVIHDTVTPDAWEQSWAGIAAKYKLQYTPPRTEKLSAK
jgi:hypothetical protein